MNVNFFEWLRNGVRQSVLLGVSDAVEQIGIPNEKDEVNSEIAALFDADLKKKAPGRAAGRKRLGKSLKEMNSAPTKK